jgi:AAA domain
VIEGEAPRAPRPADQLHPDDSTPLDVGPSWVGLTPDEKSRRIADYYAAQDLANGVEVVHKQPTNDDLLDGMRNGAWLDAQEFPPLRYAVPGLVPEGLSLMVGAPKIGKSWWTLDACLAVSAGGYALGRIHTGSPRPVLYLALEDSDRRLQDRCRQLLDGAPIPPRFDYLLHVASPGAVTPTIATWLEWHRGELPLVVVDTLGRAMRSRRRVKPSISATTGSWLSSRGCATLNSAPASSSTTTIGKLPLTTSSTWLLGPTVWPVALTPSWCCPEIEANMPACCASRGATFPKAPMR